MSWLSNITDKAAGALQGMRDAARGTEYEPVSGDTPREMTPRERDVYGRWQAWKDPRNAYERAAFASLPGELEAEMDRIDRLAEEADAAGAAECPAREAGN